MSSLFKKLNSTPPTPLVTLFAVVTALFVGLAVFQRLSTWNVLDFTPVVMWMVVAIPAGIFGVIFLQVRAAERAQSIAQKVHERILELEAESKEIANPRQTSEGRRTCSPRLDSPNSPPKDPFENL